MHSSPLSSLLLVAGLSASPALRAAQPAAPVSEDAEEDRRLGWVTFELDAVTTPLGARNLLMLVEPPETHWSIGGGVNAGNYHEVVDSLLFEGFDVQLRPSPVLLSDYFLRDGHEGFAAGVILMLTRYSIPQEEASPAESANLFVVPRISYRWFPFEQVNLYLTPFAGLKYEQKVAGTNQVNGEAFAPPLLSPVVTVHLGYHF